MQSVNPFRRWWPAILLLILPLAALAHHGWSRYGADDFTLTGTVEEVYLGNPHGWLKVQADGQSWNVVLGPPFRNQRAGLVEGAVQVGQTVTALGNRHKEADTYEMKTKRLTVGDTVFQIY